jgi:hypothetical protein
MAKGMRANRFYWLLRGINSATIRFFSRWFFIHSLNLAVQKAQ